MESLDLSKLSKILEGQYGQEALINTFRKVQAEYGDIPLETIPLIAKALKVAESRVYSVATFYEEFLAQQEAEQEVEVEKRPDEQISTKHKLVVLRNIGDTNPEDIGSYISAGGYSALKKALASTRPKEVAEIILSSGLREGDGSFEVGAKWLQLAETSSEKKYVVCDASDQGTGISINKVLLEGDPHSLLEGMVITAYAIGASECYLYVPYEFGLVLKRLELALKQAREKGFIGSNIMGASFDCNIEVREGPRFLSCEPEIGIITFIEGNRASPRIAPPFPKNSGLWGKPTLTGSAETFYSIPWIIQNGPDAYGQYGAASNRGTKVLALSGNVSHTGIVEVPMGINFGQLVSDIGGGIREGHQLKAVHIGGPFGGFLPANLLDAPLDYNSLSELGAGFGSRTVVILDENACIIDLAKSSIHFTFEHYCGVCVAGRLGVRQILEILTRITQGEGKEGDIQRLEQIASLMKEASLCAMCQGASNPILTSIRYFPEEYEAHISQKRCPVSVCQMSKV